MGDIITVEFSHDERAAHLTLNRPEKLNALNEQLADAVVETVEQLEDNDRTRVMTIRGAGGNFSAGGDIEKVYEYIQNKDLEGLREIESSIEQCFETVASSPITSITVVEGFALAGGFELVLASDLTIAATDAKLGDQHINYGLVAGGGTTQRLPRIVGVKRAKDLVLTGRRISGEEATEWGVANQAVDAEELDAVVEEKVEAVATKGPQSLRRAKFLIDGSQNMTLDTGLALEASKSTTHLFSSEAAEGLRAFNNDEQSEF